MVRRERLDKELVRRELARSRQHAADLIAAGRVLVGGTMAVKGTTMVERSAAVVVKPPASGAVEYVSRGGHKLAGALDQFQRRGLDVAKKNCLDAGASTGGFTDVLLRRGAKHIVAADVGYGQLAWSLQQDERVTVLDRTNIRALEPADLPWPPEIVVSDLSFISLKTVLPALVRCAAQTCDLVLMVKPQFEVGRERLGSGGVVKSPQLRIESVLSVAQHATELGLGTKDVVASPLPGPSGNVEYFLWLTRGNQRPDPAARRAANHSGILTEEELSTAVERAVAEGPSR